MNLGSFYFINDDYYKKFSGMGLSKNKEVINGKPHGRPCYYSLKDPNCPIYWMIPISSKIDKYKREYNKSINKYGLCDGISFGYVLGEKKAFLIQNMCPVTDKYITDIYIDKNTSKPISIPKKLKAELNAKIRKAIRRYRQGVKIVLTNALEIEEILLNEISFDNIQEEVAATKDE